VRCQTCDFHHKNAIALHNHSEHSCIEPIDTPQLTKNTMPAPTTAFAFDALDINGKKVALKKYAGKLLLIVNTASGCGFTPQYKGLQALHEQYGEKGLVVLGFPCNQFGGQEAGNNEEIASFCELNFGVSFPLMGKVEVNGAQASPLYQWLCEQAPGLLGSTSVKWNFTKFLVGRDGQVIKRYAPQDTPQSLAKDIEKALVA
jgi:glutathione peroxidase